MGAQAVVTSKVSEPVQFVLDNLSNRKEKPKEASEQKELRMGSVLELALAVGCSCDFMRTFTGTLKEHGIELVSIKDIPINAAVDYLNSVESSVDDLFSEELQVTIDLASAAGLNREVQWITGIWNQFTPRTIETPLAKS